MIDGSIQLRSQPVDFRDPCSAMGTEWFYPRFMLSNPPRRIAYLEKLIDIRKQEEERMMGIINSDTSLPKKFVRAVILLNY